MNILNLCESIYTQAVYACEAATNKKAVFIKKPMALTHADAKSIIEAEEINNVRLSFKLTFCLK